MGTCVWAYRRIGRSIFAETARLLGIARHPEAHVAVEEEGRKELVAP